MALERSPVKVTPESDLEALLDEATKSPVLLERHGVIYRLSQMENEKLMNHESDRDRELRMLDEVNGSWADLDTDKIIREIYKVREAGSGPLDRP
jgi:hypothetical protein